MSVFWFPDTLRFLSIAMSLGDLVELSLFHWMRIIALIFSSNITHTHSVRKTLETPKKMPKNFIQMVGTDIGLILKNYF